jgi:nicotinate-nucleotide adenylyltransferase
VRIGVFGGSFDPVHIGHLLAAECCREQAGLDRVLFVPAAIQPHKQDRQLASGQHRMEMLALATGGNDAFAVSGDELERGGVSYTVDTLERLKARHPDDDLRLILGPDAFLGLPTWREPRRIIDLAEILAVERESLDDLSDAATRGPLETLLGRERLDRVIAERVRLPAIGIRASDLRAAVAAGQSIRYRTPRAVECFIATHGLYR